MIKIIIRRFFTAIKIFLYKLLDPLYILLDKKNVRRTKSISLIPSSFNRRGGTYSYAEWAQVIGIFQTLMFIHLKNKKNNKILDVGSGCGLLLNSSRQFIEPNGEYIGIDVVKDEINFCNSHYPKKYKFEHADALNPYYSSNQNDKLKWSYKDSTFDLVTALSVWTHLNEKDAFFYMGEVNRVLKPGGKAFISFFILDELYDKFILNMSNEKPKYHLLTQKQYIYDQKAYGSSEWFYPKWTSIPERAIGVKKKGFDKLIIENGMKLVEHYQGNWKENPGVFFQDILILEKK